MAENFDLGLIGIPDNELDALLHDTDDRASIDENSADTIPEAPPEPIARPGDIWALDDHRLICGDDTDPSVVARLKDGAQATLMFIFPPYAKQRDNGAPKLPGSATARQQLISSPWNRQVGRKKLSPRFSVGRGASLLL